MRVRKGHKIKRDEIEKCLRNAAIEVSRSFAVFNNIAGYFEDNPGELLKSVIDSDEGKSDFLIYSDLSRKQLEDSFGVVKRVS